MKENKIAKIINSRFSSDASLAVDDLFSNFIKEDNVKLMSDIIDALEQSINEPNSWKNYAIPEHIKTNNKKLREIIKSLLHEFKMSRSGNPKELRDFLVAENDFIKYAQNQWFYANPGTSIEILNVPAHANPKLLNWLKKRFNVRPGDEVVHRHALSTDDRLRLQSIGFDVPYEHWNKSYVVDGLRQTAKIIASSPENKGLLTLGSWLYNPDNYKNASDGKPIVAFTFLADDYLVGYRLSLGEATAENEFSIQYSFATNNLRRRALVRRGEFKPFVYSAFYPREELLSRFL